jgi:tetratricopeptide (TPR) repeat protein
VGNSDTPYFDHEVLEQMVAYYEENEFWNKAEELVDFALMQHPYSSDFMALKAEYYIDRNDWKQALALIEKALLQDPLAVHLHLIKSDALCTGGLHAEAIAILDALIDVVGPEELIDVHLERADVYEEWERYDDAYACLKMAIVHDPKNEEALDRIWFLMELIGNYRDCIEFHNKVINVEPYSYLAWYNLANAYVGVERYADAIDAFKMVIAINDTYEYAYSDLADVYMLLEDFALAIESYEKAIEMSKPTEELYHQIGLCYEALGQLKKARTHYRKALRLDPEFDEAYFRIAKTHLRDDEVLKALNSLNRAIKIDPSNAEYLHEAAFISFLLGEYAESSSMCIDVTVLKPNYPEAWSLAAVNFYQLGEDVMVEQVLDLAALHCPKSNELLMIRGCLWLLMNKPQEGLMMIKDALNTNSDVHVLAMLLLPDMIGNDAFMDVLSDPDNGAA